MADDQEKTEEPTSKKIEDARAEGNVAKSQDIVGVLVLFVAILGLIMMFTFIADRILNLSRYYFSLMGQPLTRELMFDMAFVTFREFLIMALPISIIVAVAGVAGTVAQIGFNFTTKPLMPNFSKLDPIKGLGNMFTLQKVLESIKITLKSFTALGIGFLFFWYYIQELPTVALFTLQDQMGWLRDKVIVLAAVMLIIITFYALIDLFLTRKQYFDKLKMSKQEIKDEFKNMEGDPHIKAKIRQIQFQAARKRMMASVPTADVVITNPTHYAVAIKYDETKHNAPVVVAKGVDNIAIQIKKIARENGVHIVQNPPLARSLYKEVEIDRAIPDMMFAAVAEVLAYVYKMGKKRKETP
ncbi:flagellar biosynthesis protein FlhB [Sulfuricurvum sp.]|uniref:flagellar biosynthesis protein FlhB n=2 Tax=Sulfuricurvum sp. TaxID=2025608 RepID=UPI002601FAB4|nr:flagellar biosynthesis protein FlhB [Sulfuricurvum sp.]MDD2265398.1 flagellar biosynthesis protein FlhB [Sulfuricurvum sp.]MDD2784939.1 flagellar biosynthesis protein FlhB [Sulfuricurvum sp.]